MENPWHGHVHMLKEVACNLKAFSPLLIEGQFLKNTVYQEAFPLSFQKSLFQISAISCVWRHPGHEIPLSLTAEDVSVRWTLILDNNEAVRQVMSTRLCKEAAPDCLRNQWNEQLEFNVFGYWVVKCGTFSNNATIRNQQCLFVCFYFGFFFLQ